MEWRLTPAALITVTYTGTTSVGKRLQTLSSNAVLGERSSGFQLRNAKKQTSFVVSAVGTVNVLTFWHPVFLPPVHPGPSADGNGSYS